MSLTSVADLRLLYPAAKERARRKELSRLDAHCRRFIELSPFLVLASADASGAMDASPRGGAPGFVRVGDENTLWIPDAPGNNRLDSLENIVATGRIGLIFLIPGVDETLRVNGRATLETDEAALGRFAGERRAPKLAIRVRVEQAYLHCAKALMRSALWSDDSRIARETLPTMGRMISDQTGGDMPVETQEQMLARYQQDL